MLLPPIAISLIKNCFLYALQPCISIHYVIKVIFKRAFLDVEFRKNVFLMLSCNGAACSLDICLYRAV